MDVVTFFVTRTQTPEVHQPSGGRFNEPAEYAQATAVRRVAPGDHRPDPSLAQRLADLLIEVVRTVGEELIRASARTAYRPPDRRDRVDQRNRLVRIVAVGTGVGDDQRRASAIG